MLLDDAEKKHLDPRRVSRSLNRSEVRKGTHLYLCKIYPNEETIEEISAATGYDERDIRGALLGEGSRYMIEDALISSGLAKMREEEYHGQKIMLFSATSKGEDIDELLRDYALHNTLSYKLKKYIEEMEVKLKKQKLK